MRSGLYGRIRQISYPQAATPVAPGQVTGLVVGTPAASSVPLTWQAPAAGTVPFTYRVEYKRAVDAAWSVDTTLSATARTVAGLLASTAYQFRVRAENSAGAGPYSAVVSATTASQQIIVTSDGSSVTSISPAGASAVPGAPAVPGATGELVDVGQYSEDSRDFLSTLVLRGNYSSPAQLPFATLTVRGSVTWSRSDFVSAAYDGSVNLTIFRTTFLRKRLLVSGQNTFLFT